MATPIQMPRLTIDMEKGTVLEWRKEEGDPVEKGEIVAVVFGDKVEWEVEVPAAGVLLKILAAPEEEVAVNRPIAWVGAPGEAVPSGPPAAPAPAAAAAAPAPPSAGEAGEAGPGAAAPGRLKASPAAKRLAKELGVDLGRVRGTGPGGRIVEADVVSASGGAAPAAGAVPPAPAREPVALTPLRRTIGERMSRSWRTVPHFTVECEVDLGEARAFRESVREGGRTPATFTDLAVAAVGRALRQFEGMRLRWEGDALVRLDSSAVGVAVHTEEGLLVPVVDAAGEKGLERIGAEIRALAERARAGKLRPEDLRPACITVTNLGMFGISRFTPVINHPECSILAMGEVRDTPVAREDRVIVRPVAALDLSVDHRAIDGGLASWFLGRVKEILEKGEWRA